MIAAAKAMALATIKTMEDPELLQKAKEEVGKVHRRQVHLPRSPGDCPACFD